eukprot:COSAG04_NODE_25411_length_308_cov_0.645933_1_plen_24_part_10
MHKAGKRQSHFCQLQAWDLHAGLE